MVWIREMYWSDVETGTGFIGIRQDGCVVKCVGMERCEDQLGVAVLVA